MFRSASIARPVAIKEPLSIVMRSNPIGPRVGRPRPIAFVPLVMSACGIPIPLHPDEIGSRCGRFNVHNSRRRRRPNTDSHAEKTFVPLCCRRLTIAVLFQFLGAVTRIVPPRARTGNSTRGVRRHLHRCCFYRGWSIAANHENEFGFGGSLISSLPVAYAVPVPAPAPAAVPMTAPLPPPTIAPRIAPAAAPPPISAVFRAACDLPSICKGCVLIAVAPTPCS